MRILELLRQDIVYAARGLRRTPGFSIAVALTLGLGIGVNAATFSLLVHVFGETPKGVAAPGEVRRLYKTFAIDNRERLTSSQFQFPEYRALRAALDPSTQLGLFTNVDSAAIVNDDTHATARVMHVSRGYFEVLGVRAPAGRLFSVDEDDVTGSSPVAVISDGLWRRAFGSDRKAIGRNVTIGRRQFTIVGIAPPGFTGIDLDAADVWLPLNTYETGSVGGLPWYQMFGQTVHIIAHTTNPAAERTLLDAATRAIRTVRAPGEIGEPTTRVVAGPIVEARGPMRQRDEIVVATRVAAVALMVLLIAAANVANLLLLRASRRRREIAVRRALGVSHARLAGQFTVESVILALAGGASALVFTLWAGAALRQLVLPRVHWAGSPIDARTVGFAVVASLLIGVVGGLAPVAQAIRPDLAESLKAGERDNGRRGAALRGLLLGLQTSLCVVLLVGAGLFARSLDNVRGIGVGYDVDDRLFIRPLFDDPYGHDAELQTALPELERRLGAMDGVLDVAYSTTPPLQGSAFRQIFLPGQADLPQLPEDYGPSMFIVSPSFFRASGLHLVAGREFTAGDRANAQPVGIVGESTARLYWPGEAAIGKCFMILKRDGPCVRVIGVAADVHRKKLVEAPIAQIYVPIAQRPEVPHELIVHAKPGQEPRVIRTVEQALRSMNVEISGLRARTFASVLEPELRPWRLGTTLFSALGMLALIVATVGVYSVVAFGVSQRIREMGIRIALGAQRRDVLDLILGDGMRVVAIGIAVGVVVSLILGRYVASLLFGVVPSDPSTLIAAACVLSVAAAAACLVPGWRAASVDPIVGLQSE